MRVVHFISHFPYPDQLESVTRNERYVCSGGEWAAHRLVTEQAKAGHDVSVVTSSVGRTDEWDRSLPYTVRRYGSRFRIGETHFAPGMFTRPMREMSRPDIVHIHHTTPPGGMAGWICGRSWNRPLVVTHHGFEKPDSYGNIIRRTAVYLSAEWFVDALFARAHRIIYISAAFLKQSRFLGKYATKTTWIPHGIDPAEYHTEISMEEARRELGWLQEKRHGLFVGTLIPPKGLGVLLEALPDILAKHPDFILHVLGRGPSESTFRRYASKMGIADHVVFAGFIGDPREKLLYYRASDVLIIPSPLSEMYCFVLYEGAASGCCLVTSDLAVFRSVIKDHSSGMITPAGNPAGIAQAVMEVLDDKTLQRRLMTGSRTQIPFLSWREVAQRTERVYDAVIRDNRR